MKRTPSKLFFSALIASILCLSANSILYAAEEKANQTTPAAIDLDLIQEELEFLKEENVSIAAAHEQPISEAPSNVYVVTAEDIRQSGAVDIPTVLRRIPGMEVMQTTGAEFNVSVRGDNQIQANKLLVMVDGRSIYDDEQGVINWKALPVSLIEIKRIEVLKGPASVLYGFNAFDGVINIITKSPEEMKGTTMQIGGGEFGTITSSAVHAGKTGRFGYRLSVGHDRNNEWNDRNAAAYRASRFNIHTEYDLASDSTIVAQGGLIDANKFDGPSAGVVDATQKPDFGYAHMKFNTGGFFLQGWWNHLDSPSVVGVNPLIDQFFRIQDKDGSNKQTFKWNSYNVEARQTLKFGSFYQLTGGANYRHNGVDSNFLSKKGKEDRLGLYIQNEIKPTQKLSAVAGVRMDLDTFINPTYSPRIALIYTPVKDQTFRASFSIAYRPPTIFDTFLQSTGVTTLPFPFVPPIFTELQGSENLKPEKNTSFEVGYQGWFFRHRIRFRIDAFYNHITNLISSVSSASGGPPEFVNGRYANIYGVEPGVEFLATPWLTGFVNFSIQDINQKFTGEDRRGGPDFKANVGLRGEWQNGLSAETTFYYYGQSTYPISDAFTTFGALPGGQAPPSETVGDYTLLNLRGAYRFWEQRTSSGNLRDAEVAVTVFNALNDKHREHPLGEKIKRRVMGWLTINF